MHPFLRARVDNDNSSTVDMINSLSNDTLQNIKMDEMEGTYGTTKYADSGVESGNINLELLVQEIEDELQSGNDRCSYKSLATHSQPSFVASQSYKTPVPSVKHPFMASDASFTSSVKQQEYLNLPHQSLFQQTCHQNTDDTNNTVNYDPQPPLQYVGTRESTIPNSVNGSRYSQNSSIRSPSIYSSHANGTTKTPNYESARIKRPSIITGSETVQLEQGMYKLLEKYGIQ